MYHHRYQPSQQQLANKNAYPINNFSLNQSQSSTLSLNTTHQHSTTVSSPKSKALTSSPFLVHNNSPNNNINEAAVTTQAYSSNFTKKFIEERQDVIFRRVRGILNKITPETFDKLSKELINVGIDSPRTLRGVIYLLFDKALKDLKYSSLYAKLCQELSEKAPNFETDLGPNTFCKFLISKCEDEFERRRKATEDFERKHELTDEEYEQKAIAKQKMLGNIKFICELGKKRLLKEEILHECIRGLLSKKKERPLQDQAQDLECLCQIMRTIGSLLDIQASRNLMNQYFERIDMYSKRPELPSRIRFMLRDVIDLRNNNWRPRPFQREDNVPQPLSKLREEAGYDMSPNSSLDKLGNTKNLTGLGGLSKLHKGKLSSLLLDDEPSFTTTTDFHWGPTFMSHEPNFDVFSSSNTSVRSKDAINRTTVVPNPTNVPFSRLGQSAASYHELQPSNNHVIIDSAGGMHRFDPFTDPANGRLRHDRQAINNLNNSMHRRNTVNMNVKKHPQRDRNLDGGYPDVQLLPEISAGQTDSTFIGYSDIQGSSQLYRPRNVHMPDFPEKSKIYPAIYDEQTSMGPRRVLIDGPRNMNTQPARSSISPNSRSIHNRRPNQRDIPAPNIVNPSQYQQHPVEHQPPVTQDQQSRFEPAVYNFPDGAVQDMGRGRRSNRGPKVEDHHTQESRQTRFPGPNSRQPVGRDKPPLGGSYHFYDKMNNHSESELNLNWRQSSAINPSSTESPTTAFRPVQNLRAPPKARPKGEFEEPPREGIINRQGLISAQIVPSIDIAEPRSHVLNIEAKIPLEMVHENGEKLPSVQRMKETLNGDLNRDFETSEKYFPARQMEEVPYPIRPIYPDSRLHQPILGNQNSPPTSRRNPRRAPRTDIRLDNNANQAPSGLKSNQRSAREREPVDRQDQNKRYGFHTGSDNSVTRHSDDTRLQVDRNHKSHMSRNQSFENHQQHSGQGPVSNWRKENVPNNSVSAPLKDQLPNPFSAFSNPLLARPHSAAIDSNFSLRPSHNLMGKTLSVASNPSQKSSSLHDSGSPQVLPKQKDKTGEGKYKSHSEVAQVSSQTGTPVADSSYNEKNLQSDASDTKKAAKEFHVNKFISVLSEYSNESPLNINRTAAKVKELKIPKDYQGDCLVRAMKQSIQKTEPDRENTSKLLVHLVPSIFEVSSLITAFTIIFEQLQSLEVETPRVKSLVAGFLSQAVFDKVLLLEEVGNILAGGKHHPLFLLILQKLKNSAGQAWLSERFTASKINLMDMLPEVDRTKERLISALKDRCLGFLDPMLTIEPDLWALMKERDASPAVVYRWIKDNVDQTMQDAPAFAHVFLTCLIRYIHEAAKESNKESEANKISTEDDLGHEQSDASKDSPASSSGSVVNEAEEKLLTKYQQVLQAILMDKKLQLASLYALQSFYHALDFPKGALLRWFNMFYDLNIVDEDVYSTWKEEINDKFPGKGQALFQVNSWLNWLAEAESEEEDDDEDS